MLIFSIGGKNLTPGKVQKLICNGSRAVNCRLIISSEYFFSSGRELILKSLMCLIFGHLLLQKEVYHNLTNKSLAK